MWHCRRMLTCASCPHITPLQLSKISATSLLALILRDAKVRRVHILWTQLSILCTWIAQLIPWMRPRRLRKLASKGVALAFYRFVPGLVDLRLRVDILLNCLCSVDLFSISSYNNYSWCGDFLGPPNSFYSGFQLVHPQTHFSIQQHHPFNMLVPSVCTLIESVSFTSSEPTFQFSDVI